MPSASLMPDRSAESVSPTWAVPVMIGLPVATLLGGAGIRWIGPLSVSVLP